MRLVPMRLGSTEGYGCHRGIKARDGKKKRKRTRKEKRRMGRKEKERAHTFWYKSHVQRRTILVGTSPTSCGRYKPLLRSRDLEVHFNSLAGFR